MIIWLASYPRSGNTLLRTLLYQTMGLASVTDENDESDKGLDNSNRFMIGLADRPHPWDEFYRTASESRKLFLVKTHRPPRDDFPAIYVVRDGRKSCLSYSHFHRSFSPETHPSLLDVVLGNDYYGNWSGHFKTWATRKNTLLVSYEDLVKASESLVAKLATHLGYCGPIAAWQNPFDQLHQAHPNFFRQGETEWQNDPEWPLWIDALFFHLHGDLMIKLDYCTPEAVSAARSNLPNDFLPLLNKAHCLVTEKKQFEQICADRQLVIEGLKHACDERLNLIQALNNREVK